MLFVRSSLRVMRRLIASIVALFTLGMFLAPAALATTGPQQPLHACCRRAHHHGHDCDQPSVAPATDHQAARASTCCQQCNLPALTFQAARPNRPPEIETPSNQHSFAQEFYPRSDSQQEAQPQSPRAPPPSTLLRPIHSVVSFFRNLI